MVLPFQDRADISRKNGAKGRGPTTMEGRRRASMNALQHGLRAEMLILPGEDREALEEHREDWMRYFRPQSPAAYHYVNLCITAELISARCTQALEATLENQAEEVDDYYEEARNKMVAE